MGPAPKKHLSGTGQEKGDLPGDNSPLCIEPIVLLQLSVALFETLYASCSIDQLLFTSEKWMTC